MVCRKMATGQEKTKRLDRSKVRAKKKMIYVGNRKIETGNNCKSY